MSTQREHRMPLAICGLALIFLFCSNYGPAADVKLAWDANTETILSGYKLYWGTASGNYSNNIDVGNVTTYTLTGLNPGTYYFAVTAYSIYGDETGYSNEVTTTISGSDATAPSITITVPTSGDTYSTSSNTISLGGTASDNVAVTQVTWSNDRGGSGTASGTTAWSISSISLQSGANILTVTARDAAGNIGTTSLTVIYQARPPAPTRLRIIPP
jgi:hypothetical protein